MVDTAFPENVQQSVQLLDPFTKEQTIQLMEDARRIAEPAIEIPTQEVAGFDPLQTKAFEEAQAGLGTYQPFLGTAPTDISAAGLYERAARQYDPQAAAIAEGLAETRRALDPTTTALGYAEGARREFDPADIAKYQDPFTEQVIETQLADIDRQRDLASQGIASQAARAGAFGGSRYGIQQAELERNAAEQRNRIAAQLRSQGFQQAQEAAMRENTRLGQLGLQQAGAVSDIGRGYGQIGGQLASIGSGYGNVAQGQAGIAQGLGALGQLGTSLQTQDINLLSQLGGIKRASEQAEKDAAFQQKLSQKYEPFQRVSFVSDILRGTPSGGQTLSVASAPLPNPFTQSLGAGLATAGLFAPKRSA